jgi:hypothetical protein
MGKPMDGSESFKVEPKRKDGQANGGAESGNSGGLGNGAAEGRSGPIDGTALRNEFRDAADTFLDSEGRPPTAKELSALVHVGSPWIAQRFLTVWREERAVTRPQGTAKGPADPIDGTPLRKRLCEAADTFLEKEGRPPTAKELVALAGVSTAGSVKWYLSVWRRERAGLLRAGNPAGDRLDPFDLAALRGRMRDAAERFLEREGRTPMAKELHALAGGTSYWTTRRFLSEWRKERGLTLRQVDADGMVSPIDGTPVRRKLCKAADTFLEREGRPPSTRKLRAFAGAGSYGAATKFLLAWREARGFPRRRCSIKGARESIQAAADRFTERMGRCPSAKELFGEGTGFAFATVSLHLARWRRERNLPVAPPGGRFRHDLARTAEAMLASTGRAPTVLELRDAMGRGCFKILDGFLGKWCRERGLPRSESTPRRPPPAGENGRRLWEAFREAADRFFERTRRGPTGRELQAETGQGSLSQASEFLRDWRVERGPAVGTLRRHMELAADEFLAAHGRAPTVDELVGGVGRGSKCAGWACLRKWREKRGLPRPEPRLPQKRPIREDVRVVIDALAEELGRVPRGREIEMAHGGISCWTALAQRKKWLELEGIPQYPKKDLPSCGSGMDATVDTGVPKPPKRDFPSLRRQMESAADEFLAAHGRAPTANELMRDVGRGSKSTGGIFLREWREKRGLPRPKLRVPKTEAIREDVWNFIEALTKERGTIPSGREIKRVHGGISYETATRHRKEWLEAGGILKTPEDLPPAGSGKADDEASE